MSYIAPDTDIYLLANVECDKSYDNVKYFATENAQHTYMSDKIVKSLLIRVTGVSTEARSVSSAKQMTFINATI